MCSNSFKVIFDHILLVIQTIKKKLKRQETNVKVNDDRNNYISTQCMPFITKALYG